MVNAFTQLTWDGDTLEDARYLIRLAVREDLSNQQDWTTMATVGDERRSSASIVSRQSGVVAGIGIVATVFEEMNISANVDLQVADGDKLESGTVLCTLSGLSRDLLTAERTILNFLGRLCGVATQTASYVHLLQGTGARVYDTRKTTPGWRRLEKYAVGCGGGVNHRTGLFDAILIKDNHLAANAQQNDLDDMQAAVVDVLSKARQFIANLGPERIANTPVEIEVDTLEQLAVALPCQPDIILLDNMSLAELRQAVQMRDELSIETQLEASGGVTAETLADIGKTGVDRVSVGALTHSAINLDLGLDWQ
ncbi:MAG: nicotinate-nucleotide diphosphorylase (carboxylating) [Planctomycetaceae bacterium]|nr:nicotinate-nucleotide diphosphorylase (carboxylating) [Planctomycetaceae bacterium]|tara:strand:- start:3803 stop:4732 length:930 start_codon:yes stop_codon:yes gene_type:complete